MGSPGGIGLGTAGGQTGSLHPESTGPVQCIIYYKYIKHGYIKIPDHKFIGHYLGGKPSDSKPHGLYG